MQLQHWHEQYAVEYHRPGTMVMMTASASAAAAASATAAVLVPAPPMLVVLASRAVLECVRDSDGRTTGTGC